MTKLILRDTMDETALRALMKRTGITVDAKREAWIVAHATHQGLEIGSDRLYCRTCRAVG